ncbi:MAG: flagellar export chaperone FliS [Aquificota bacterium]|nr:MAG: flagellar export chaperone FliS [Aquificota bacterium]
MSNPYETYHKYEVETLSKEDTLIKVYEEILSLLNITKMAIKEGDIKLKANNIKKLTDAFNILQASLDFEKGGEIAENLNQLYQFCSKELMNAHLHNNIENIDNVIKVLTPIYEGYKEAKDNLK